MLVTLLGCSTKIDFPQTKEFYINDNAKALLSSTKWTILEYSEELYIDSQDDEYEQQNISGAQVVVATYEGDVGDINTTELFNQWGIGRNDMGLLIVLFFDKINDELIYKELVIEIGDKMRGYISAFEANGIVEDYFYNLDTSDYDFKVISLYFKILEIIYLRIYGYNSYDYQSFIDEYTDNQYEYFRKLPSEETNFFESIPLWLWIVIIIFIVSTGSYRWIIPFVFSGSRSFRNSGGGGKSSGYWFRK